MIAVDVDITAGRDSDDGQDVAHQAFDLALSTTEPLILFRRLGWLRWEATRWQAERVETSQAVYVFAALQGIGMGATRWGARRALR